LLLFVIMPIFDWLKPIVLPLVKLLIENKFILLLAGIYIIFKEQIEKLFTVAIVEPFLSNCVSSPWNDKIFLVILLWAICLCVYRLYKRFYILGKGFLISMLLLVVWGHYRFYEHVWAFESFTFWNGLKYVDSIAVFMVANLLVWIFFYIENVSHLLTNITLCFERKTSSLKDLWNEYLKNKTCDNEPKGFCFDSPISKSDEDLLNRKELAIDVCKRIQNTANKDTSFAIGVTSQWGNGKTSFLNLIERNLDFDKNKRVVIHYNPWLNSDKKSATLSFFDEMSAALKAYDSSLSNDILKYAKMLIDSSGGKYANLLNTCLNLDATPTLRERFEEINDAIKRTRLQIIVFIDDLDRLYDSEILEVLSLIRNSANFSNTIFIVAYDRNYLVAALKKVNEYHPQAYLEKIFQLELPLPQFERDIIVKILKDKLLPYLLDEDKDELEDIALISIDKYNSEYYINKANRTIPDFILDGIKTIRDVNRLVNSFLVAYDLLKKEIVLADLLKLELLKIRYLGVYELLANNMKLLLTIRDLSTGEITLGLRDGSTSKTILLFEYLQDHGDDVSVSEHQIEDVMKYVEYIFSKRSFVVPKSIVSPTGVRRYFHYALLNGNLSQIEFDNLRDDKSDSNYWSYIKNNISNTFELKGFLDVPFYKNDNDYKRILCSLLYVASYTNKKDRSTFLNPIVRMVVDKRFKIFVDHLDEEVEDDIYNDINKGYMNALMSRLFTESELCKSESGIPFFTLCAKKWFHIFAKNIILVLKTNKDVSTTDSSVYCYKIIPAILEIFQDWAKFESFINELDESRSKGLKEFKDFYQKLKEADFKEIEYDFKEIDPEY